ncbi:class I SAM-dependent methyltransferase [Streptomyces sp. CAU 1734]|uniref:class I SAM-dependent methyltransferase n=1 Tax=Streptomyces sp. CAU 1734 TaxID=3140360 RepID=UPI00325FE715
MTLLRDQDLADAFDRAARGYDRLTALHPGYRADLRRSVRRLRLPGSGAGLRLLDLGCGTGASTRELLRAAPYADITAVDASAGMLERAAAKPWPPWVRFVHSPVEKLADAGVTGEDGYDAVLAAYLFRNVTDPDAVLGTVRGLLVPGGRLAVHEYSLGGSAPARALWDAVCRGVIIPAGTVTGDRDLHRYLWRSVRSFDTAPEFAARIGRAGFRDVRTLPMPGWRTGIVQTFLALRGPAGDGPEAR